MPTHFLAIRPPAAIRGRLARVMSALGDEVPLPHVTLRAPAALDDVAAWLVRARGVVAPFPPFEVTLGGPATFDDRVAYLRVASEGVRALHRRLLEALGPSTGRDVHEGDAFVAHLTIATAHGRGGLRLDDRLVASLGPWGPFVVRTVVVYERDALEAQYHVAHALRLGTDSARPPGAVLDVRAR